MLVVFYLAAAVALASTVMVITRLRAVHALLYLIVAQLAVAVIFFVLGAPFVAALEVIIYAGAIVVLFVFVVMMLNLGEMAAAQERQWLQPRMWIGPSILAVLLLGELLYMLGHPGGHAAGPVPVAPQQVGLALFGPYLLGVELAAMLLLAGLIGAYHLGRRQIDVKLMEDRYDLDSRRTRAIPRGEPVRPGADRPSGAA
jgi:NADH-quinone oxidoreductase subunit J